MDQYPNPFTPSFGEIPARLAGREALLAPLRRAFESTGRAPELTTLITGARGSGKTTLLSVIASEASQRGWVCAEVTAGEGMLDDIELRAKKGAAHLINDGAKMRIAHVGIPDVLSLELDRPSSKGNWRLAIESLLDELENAGSGLVITVDEVDQEIDEVRQLASVYQHFVRENRKIALFMAGLPHHVSLLLADGSVTFLRRAFLFALEPLGDDEVADALAKTVAQGGRTISPAGIEHAVGAIGGFPYLLQLVGYRMWDVNPACDQIGDADVDMGIQIAKREMERQVLQPTYRVLSDGDVAFLEAMVQDAGDSRIADIIVRLGVSSSQASQYRRRLIDAGIIGERRRGVIGFDLPYFREYVAKHQN